MIALSPEQHKIVCDILEKYTQSTKVRVFGSRVKGTHRPSSDLDLAIITTTPLSIRTLSELENAFSNSTLPFSVDIVDWATLSDSFKAHINAQYEVL